MALLLRVWRIPTRLVVGYKGGEYDPDSGAFVFRDKHSHAWVEVYFNGLGWVEFDPTPGAATVSEHREGLVAAVGRGAAWVRDLIVQSYRSTRAFWGGRVLGYGRTQQRRLMQGLSQAASSLTDQASAVVRSFWPGMPDIGALEVALLVVGMTFTGLGVFLSARWLQGRLVWPGPRRGSEKTVAFYRELLRVLRRKGVERPPQLTPREFTFVAAAALATSNEDGHGLASALRAVTDLYYRVRFGGYEASPQEMEAARAAIRKVSRASRVRHSRGRPSLAERDS
jgi:hypothetical protein